MRAAGDWRGHEGGGELPRSKSELSTGRGASKRAQNKSRAGREDKSVHQEGAAIMSRGTAEQLAAADHACLPAAALTLLSARLLSQTGSSAAAPTAAPSSSRRLLYRSLRERSSPR